MKNRMKYEQPSSSVSVCMRMCVYKDECVERDQSKLVRQ